MRDSADWRHLRAQVRQTFQVFSRTPHAALRWVTTVIAAYVVDLNDDIRDQVRRDVEEYHERRRAVYRKSGYIRRNIKTGQTRWAGVIELDLLHPRMIASCSKMKLGLLLEMGVDVFTIDRNRQRILILHEHAIVDGRGHPSIDHLARDLRETWPGPRRLHFDTTYPTNTVAESADNLARLAGYCTKNRFEYSISWNGSRTRYHVDYEDTWKEYVLGCYAAIGSADMLDANVSHQVKTSCPMYVSFHGHLMGTTDDHEILAEKQTEEPENLHDRSDLGTKTGENGIFPSLQRTMRRTDRKSVEELQLCLLEDLPDQHSPTQLYETSRSSHTLCDDDQHDLQLPPAPEPAENIPDDDRGASSTRSTSGPRMTPGDLIARIRAIRGSGQDEPAATTRATAPITSPRASVHDVLARIRADRSPRP